MSEVSSVLLGRYLFRKTEFDSTSMVYNTIRQATGGGISIDVLNFNTSISIYIRGVLQPNGTCTFDNYTEYNANNVNFALYS